RWERSRVTCTPGWTVRPRAVRDLDAAIAQPAQAPGSRDPGQEPARDELRAARPLLGSDALRRPRSGVRRGLLALGHDGYLRNDCDVDAAPVVRSRDPGILGRFVGPAAQWVGIRGGERRRRPTRAPRCGATLFLPEAG